MVTPNKCFIEQTGTTSRIEKWSLLTTLFRKKKW
jgi:hypothetical protein